MSKLPSQKLIDWLEERMRTAKPGDRLPPDTELASSFSLSPRTVERIFKKFKNEGRLVRIRGRGTFIPGGKELETRQPPEVRSSVQSIVDVMLRAISSGNLMRGSPLPQIKYITRKFKAGSATVSEAYRELEKNGYVIKMGKSYWVGSFETIVRPQPKMEIYLFKHNSLDFSDIFTTNSMALAYRKMEQELTRQGYILRFESSSAVPDIVREFGNKRRRPYGMIFFEITKDLFNELFPVLKKLFRDEKRQSGLRFPILLDLRKGTIIEPVPRGFQVFSRGHLSTSTAQAIAKYLVGNVYKKVVFFIDANRNFWDIPSDAAFLRLFNEVQHRNPMLDQRYAIISVLNDRPLSEFKLKLRMHLGKNYERIVAKYEGKPFSDFEKSIFMATDIEYALANNQSADLWLFSNAAHAEYAFEWCNKNKRNVPDEISIISLENDPRCYHLGLSYCDIEWDKIGSVLANIFSSNIPIRKTSKGFISTESRVVERLSTKIVSD